ncbi:hypothetical protein [Marivita geojedonensis]|uniref:ABM domain-containing protein n=1 Tax=Marivita geojedonensis TaxID=1123756 RepID=A0A1X4NAA5_9RHOB|nr:hypothetical protein [Marivita geojedonensis]OSQ43373.1 hypothetical protein MGEO_19725 [Marivita geojedonensis]PRY72177.1 hypothetical protein CLV76_13616 [Marivita geojedonensis]
MFARVTAYKLKAGAKNAAIATMEEMKADILALPGMKHFINVLGDDDSGYVVSIVESQEVSDNNADRVRALWGRMADHLAEMPTPSGGEVVANWTP